MPQVAALGSDQFVVVWDGGGDKSGDIIVATGIWATVLSSDGSVVTPEFDVTSRHNGWQNSNERFPKGEAVPIRPAIAASSSIVVAWEREFMPYTCQPHECPGGPFVQVLTTTGEPFHECVDNGSIELQSCVWPETYPDVAMLPNGGFVVVWQSVCMGQEPEGSVYLQVFSSNCMTWAPIRISDYDIPWVYLNDERRNAKVSVLPNGYILVAFWENRDDCQGTSCLIVKRFYSNGAELPAAPIAFSEFETGGYMFAVDAVPDGRAIVFWTGFGPRMTVLLPDGSVSGEVLDVAAGDGVSIYGGDIAAGPGGQLAGCWKVDGGSAVSARGGFDWLPDIYMDVFQLGDLTH